MVAGGSVHEVMDNPTVLRGVRHTKLREILAVDVLSALQELERIAAALIDETRMESLRGFWMPWMGFIPVNVATSHTRRYSVDKTLLRVQAGLGDELSGDEMTLWTYRTWPSTHVTVQCPTSALIESVATLIAPFHVPFPYTSSLYSEVL